MTHQALIERITRSLAYMLRHQPEQFDLELDEHGFGDLEDVVHALNERLGESVDEQDVVEAVSSGDRMRYEIKGDRIRALYGHSIEVKPGEPAKPPPMLYVGVSSADGERAHKYGLRAGRRRFLHLALTPEDALETGRRASRDYVVVTVNALDAWEEGINFYDRKALFLSDPIPTQFLQVGDVQTDGYAEIESEGNGHGRHARPGDRGRRGPGGDRGRPLREDRGPVRAHSDRPLRDHGDQPVRGQLVGEETISHVDDDADHDHGDAPLEHHDHHEAQVEIAPAPDRRHDDRGRGRPDRGAPRHAADRPHTASGPDRGPRRPDGPGARRPEHRPHGEASNGGRGDGARRGGDPRRGEPQRGQDRPLHEQPRRDGERAHSGGDRREGGGRGPRDESRGAARSEPRAPYEPRRDEPRRDDVRRDEPRRVEARRDEPRRDEPRRDTFRREERPVEARADERPREDRMREDRPRDESRGAGRDEGRGPRGPRSDGPRDRGPREDARREPRAPQEPRGVRDDGPREDRRGPAAPPRREPERAPVSAGREPADSSSFGLGIFDESRKPAPRPPPALPRERAPERVEIEKPRQPAPRENDDLGGFGAGV